MIEWLYPMKRRVFLLKIIVFAIVLIMMHAFKVDAAGLTSLSDTMSRLKIGQTSNHTIAFTTPTGITADGSTITLTFPTGFNLTNLIEDDIDVSGSTTGELTTAVNCNDGEEVGIAVSGQILTIEFCNGDGGDIAAGETVTIEIGTQATANGIGANQIINPSSASSYTVNIAGTMTDAGQFTVIIFDDDQVSITATVDQVLVFDVDVSTSDSETSAPFAVDMGTLNSSLLTTSDNTAVESIFIDVDTNATGGVTVSVRGASGGLASTTAANTISLTTAEESISAGSEEFGLCVYTINETTGGPFVAASQYDSTGGSCNLVNTGTQVVGRVETINTAILNTSTDPIEAGRAEILLKASITGATPGGADYAETLTFTAVGTF